MDITSFIVSTVVIIIMLYAAYTHVKQFTWSLRQVMTLLAILTIIVCYSLNILIAMHVIPTTYDEAIISFIFISFIIYFIARPKKTHVAR